MHEFSFAINEWKHSNIDYKINISNFDNSNEDVSSKYHILKLINKAPGVVNIYYDKKGNTNFIMLNFVLFILIEENKMFGIHTNLEVIKEGKESNRDSIDRNPIGFLDIADVNQKSRNLESKTVKNNTLGRKIKFIVIDEEITEFEKSMVI